MKIKYGILVLFFNLFIFNTYAVFYQNDTYGQMQRLNHYLDELKDHAWMRLSNQLEKMSDIVINTHNLPEPRIKSFEELWKNSIDLERNNLNSDYNNAIKQLSIAGAKGNFNDPLYYTEIKFVKRMYDFSIYLLNKMKNSQYQIYTGFWRYPLDCLINIQGNVFLQKPEKIDFIFNLTMNYLQRQPNKQNTDTTILLINYLCKFNDELLQARLNSIYQTTTNKEIKEYIKKLLQNTKSD